jgi:hypothetical protein
MLPTPKFIHGVHDIGGEEAMIKHGRPGWVVVSESIGLESTYGRDFTRLSVEGLGVLTRLNHGYWPDGTIPRAADYDKFAVACGQFVSSSAGCRRWIVGNEPNHVQERPSGHPILPGNYAECYRLVYDAIHAQPGHYQDEVIVAAIAPWDVRTPDMNNPTGDWLIYFENMLSHINPQRCDGIALHAYTHGSDPQLIYSDAKMQPPFQERFYHWRAYTQFMERIPVSMRHLPVYITEANQGDSWSAENTGWVQAAYGDINWWNEQPWTQKILAMCLYRWQQYDKWGFQGNNGVIADFLSAIETGYRVPDAFAGLEEPPPETELAVISSGSWAAMVDKIKDAADRAELLAGDLREIHKRAKWFGGDT